MTDPEVFVIDFGVPLAVRVRRLGAAVNRAASLTSRRRAPAALAPQATVIHVDCAADEFLWKDAVDALARRADLILFDLSTASPNVEWEIETALAKVPRRCRFVGGRELPPHLREKLQGHRILLHGGGHPIDRHRLENLLDSTG